MYHHKPSQFIIIKPNHLSSQAQPFITTILIHITTNPLPPKKGKKKKKKPDPLQLLRSDQSSFSMRSSLKGMSA